VSGEEMVLGYLFPLLEKARTKARPVQRVVNHPVNINSPDSTHDGILSLRSPRLKVRDTFSLPPFSPPPFPPLARACLQT